MSWGSCFGDIRAFHAYRRDRVHPEMRRSGHKHAPSPSETHTFSRNRTWHLAQSLRAAVSCRRRLHRRARASHRTPSPPARVFKRSNKCALVIFRSSAQGQRNELKNHQTPKSLLVRHRVPLRAGPSKFPIAKRFNIPTLQLCKSPLLQLSTLSDPPIP